jgi:hypothetical protein
MTLSPILPAPFVDRIVEVCASMLPRLSGGGLFWCPARPVMHMDAWTEQTAYTVQLGKLELVLDRR